MGCNNELNVCFFSCEIISMNVRIFFVTQYACFSRQYYWNLHFFISTRWFFGFYFCVWLLALFYLLWYNFRTLQLMVCECSSTIILCVSYLMHKWIYFVLERNQCTAFFNIQSKGVLAMVQFTEIFVSLGQVDKLHLEKHTVHIKSLLPWFFILEQNDTSLTRGN